MKQATYDVTNIGHFGLASKAYLHFTSPIRRYPDLVVHRMVHKVLLGERMRPLDEVRAEMADSALQASTAERRAMEVERAVVDLYRAFLMKDRIGERYEGTVSAVVGSGMFVALDSPFVDVLVRLEDMGEDRYDIDEEGLRVVAQRSGDVVSLGDRVVVEIVDVAILRRSVYGKRIHEAAREGARPPRGKAERRASDKRAKKEPPRRGPQAVDKRVDRAKRKGKKNRIAQGKPKARGKVGKPR
jgi:ribonuclease R